VSVMDHEQTMGVNSRVLDQKQQNIFGRISLFWSVELQGHPEQFQCSANLHAAINVSSQAVCCVRRGSTRHPLSEIYGLAVTEFAAWRVDISHIRLSGRTGLTSCSVYI